jgi:hypothetical protein
MSETLAPVYCKSCGSSNSWKRQPERDIKSESGRVLWERWRCGECGATTIKPVENNANYDGNLALSRELIRNESGGLIVL